MAKKKPRKPKPKSAGKNWPSILTELRERWGGEKPMPQGEAAARVGVSIRSWNGWETGKQIPAKPVQILLELLLQQARKK